MKNGDQSMYSAIWASGHIVEHAAAEKRRHVDPHCRPIGLKPPGDRVGIRHQMHRSAADDTRRPDSTCSRRLRTSSSPRDFGVQQLLDNAGRPRGVEHVNRFVLVYAGAIFTAVCLALVVAPPISSGTDELRAAASRGRRGPFRRGSA